MTAALRGIDRRTFLTHAAAAWTLATADRDLNGAEQPAVTQPRATSGDERVERKNGLF